MAINLNGTGSISGLSSISAPAISGVPTGTASAPAFSFTGDSNTGIYSPGADQVAISTGGSGRLFVDASGNVGVGATPGTSFHITRSASDAVVRIDGGSASTSFIDYRIAGSNKAYVGLGGLTGGSNNDLINYNSSAGNWIAYTNSSERLRITSTGLVGIGTSAPGSLLHLNQSSIGTYFQANASDAIRPLTITSSTTTNTGDTHIFNVSSISGRLGLATNGSTALFIDNSQRVGIGTTSPGKPLDVRGAGSANVGSFSDGTRGIDIATTASGGSIQTYDQNQTLDLKTFGTTTNSINFTVGSTERARIDSSGRLLVGTSSGTALLTVSGAYGTTQVINATNTTSGNAAGIGSSLQTAANNTSSYHFTGSTLAVGNWYLYGNGTSSWSSDERLKTNIQTTRDGYLEDIQKLRVVKYQWKNGTDQTELGLIAQEVEKIFPGLVQDDLNPVSPDDPTRYKQLKGSVLPIILLKALQEAVIKIETLEAKVAALEGA